MTNFTVVVPPLNIHDPSGVLNLKLTRQYAERAGASWIDRFLLNGSTTRGDQLSSKDRAAVLDLWIEIVGADRLLSCCWDAADLDAAADRRITPMAVIRGFTSPSEVFEFLRELPAGSTVYSHPMFGQGFGPELARLSAAAGCLPAGGKLAKIHLDSITEIHRATPTFAVWDGSSRHITESLDAGAEGVVATPLAALISGALPAKDLPALQDAIDGIQHELDQLPDRAARRAYFQARSA